MNKTHRVTWSAVGGAAGGHLSQPLSGREIIDTPSRAVIPA